MGRTYLYYLVITLLSGWWPEASAQTEGPNAGSSFANSPIAGSSSSWTNPSKAQSADGDNASAGTLSSDQYSDYITVTGFSFAVPADKTITGIEISITKSTDIESKTKDYRVQLIKNGTIGGEDKAPSSAWESHDTPTLYGGDGQLWGEAWTPDDINDPDFGIAFSVLRKAGGGGAINPLLDEIKIKIYYGAILPVELVSFTAGQSSNKVKLQWTTASELNNDYFTIERTVNGASFETVAKIKGSGNSNSTKSYSVYDENPLIGTVYYRLKQTDFDGKFEYSDLISVAINVMASPECRFIVKPNPCAGACEVSVSGCDNQEVSVALVDAFGNIVYSQVPAAEKTNTFSIDASNNLKPGVYVVMGEVQGKTFSEKMILNNDSGYLLYGALLLMVQALAAGCLLWFSKNKSVIRALIFSKPFFARSRRG